MLNKTWVRKFVTIYTGQSISLLTSSIVQFAIIWWLTEKTGSAALLSIAMMIAFLPQAILGPFIGVWIDRYNRKKIMILADSFIAITTLVLVLVGQFGEIPIPLLMAVLLARSIGGIFHAPALAASVPLLVPNEKLVQCNGYSQTFQSVSMIASPAIAGLLYGIISLNSIIMIDILGAIVGVGTIALIKIPQPVKEKETVVQNMWLEAQEGMQILWLNKGLFWLIIISALFILFFLPVSTLFPLMSLEYFKGGTKLASTVEVFWGLGILSGSLTLGAWGGFKNRIHTISLGMIVASITVMLSGMCNTSQSTLFIFWSFLMGTSYPMYFGVQMAIMQDKIPSQYLGRVISLSNSIMIMATPLGLIPVGLFADKIGINTCFFIAGIVMMTITALVYIIPDVREIDKNKTPNNTEN